VPARVLAVEDDEVDDAVSPICFLNANPLLSIRLASNDLASSRLKGVQKLVNLI
jgi:hypothetical protein